MCQLDGVMNIASTLARTLSQFEKSPSAQCDKAFNSNLRLRGFWLTLWFLERYFCPVWSEVVSWAPVRKVIGPYGQESVLWIVLRSRKHSSLKNILRRCSLAFQNRGPWTHIDWKPLCANIVCAQALQMLRASLLCCWDFPTRYLSVTPTVLRHSMFR